MNINKAVMVAMEGTQTKECREKVHPPLILDREGDLDHLITSEEEAVGVIKTTEGLAVMKAMAAEEVVDRERRKMMDQRKTIVQLLLKFMSLKLNANAHLTTSKSTSQHVVLSAMSK